MNYSDRQRQPGGDSPLWLESAIKEFWLASPENSLRNEDNERAWGEPLVGFSSGADPLYKTIRRMSAHFT